MEIVSVVDHVVFLLLSECVPKISNNVLWAFKIGGVAGCCMAGGVPAAECPVRAST